MRAALAALAALLVVPAAAEAQLSSSRACGPGVRCATLTVPLDRSGTDPGTLRLRVAMSSRYRPGRSPLLVGLTGGPGQPGVPFFDTLAVATEGLGEALVVLDQRGTGTRALRCDALQRLRGLDSYRPAAVGACGARLGAVGRHLSTADSVADLEDLRRALRASRVSLFGVSYGTHVAQQYALTHPSRVRRLLLDSALEPGGWDGFLLPLYAAVPRVLGDLCRRGGCRGVTADPVADLAAVVARLRGGPITARVPDARGRARTQAIRTGEELFFLLLASDLNGALQAMLPAALRAAAAGDAAPLVRLRAAGQGSRLSSADLSGAVLVGTDCADARLPYELSMAPEERRARFQAALDAIPETAYAPFDRATVAAASLADDCLQWPQQPDKPTREGALPDVPVLVLAGRRDLRTPLESGRRVAATAPRGRVVAVPGTGHDVLGSDTSGCAAVAVTRWRAGRAPGPCRSGGASPVAPLPPAAPATSSAARRAVEVTIADAAAAVDASVGAGLPPRAGGLRGGRARGDDRGLVLTRYEAAPGLRVSGRVGAGGGVVTVSGTWRGRVRVPGGAQRVRGTLTRSSRTAG